MTACARPGCGHPAGEHEPGVGCFHQVGDLAMVAGAAVAECCGCPAFVRLSVIR